jgi:hypothetical protein
MIGNNKERGPMDNSISVVELHSPSFRQQFNHRNEHLKADLELIYINYVKNILTEVPFCYTDQMATSISEGIVTNGEMLMVNAEEDDEDEDKVDEMLDKLNEISEEFEDLVPETLLELRLDGDNAKEKREMLHSLYPVPTKHAHVQEKDAFQCSKALEAIKQFLSGKGKLGVCASIALLGDWTEDGVVFGGSQTVPLAMIEAQIMKMLANRGIDLTPMVVDLIAVGKDSIRVSSINANGNNVKHFEIGNDVKHFEVEG